MDNAFNKTKDFLGTAYTKTKHAWGTAGGIFSKFKNVYNTFQPAIQDVAPQQLQDIIGKVDQGIKSGIEGYGNIREKIDHAENILVQGVGNVLGAINKSGIKF